MTPNENYVFISIEDAAELTGYSVKYIRKLVKQGKIRSQGKQAAEVSWKDVQNLAKHYIPFWVTLPTNALQEDIPDPNLLLYSKRSENQDSYPETYFYDKVELGNCIDRMRLMPSRIIQTVVTSPPYWGIRTYPEKIDITWADGSKVGLGEEEKVEDYVTHSLEILRQIKRVLKDNGTIWWNLGDTYQTRAYLRESSTERLEAIEGNRSDLWKDYPNKRYSSGHSYLKDKDLTLVPYQVALGAERIGLYVRSMIVWSKDNTGLDSADDRPSVSHEYIILMAKSRFYKYDATKVTENAKSGEVIKRINGEKSETTDQRNLRDVWKFPTSNKHGDHTAAFPMELPLRCLLLSTDPGDLVFDPFAGSGTTLAAAKNLNRRYYGCDIIEEFVNESRRRLEAPDMPLEAEKRKRRAKETGNKEVMENESTNDLSLKGHVSKLV